MVKCSLLLYAPFLATLASAGQFSKTCRGIEIPENSTMLKASCEDEDHNWSEQEVDIKACFPCTFKGSECEWDFCIRNSTSSNVACALNLERHSSSVDLDSLFSNWDGSLHCDSPVIRTTSTQTSTSTQTQRRTLPPPSAVTPIASLTLTSTNIITSTKIVTVTDTREVTQTSSFISLPSTCSSHGAHACFSNVIGFCNSGTWTTLPPCPTTSQHI